jgi:hypothetical protein
LHFRSIKLGMIISGCDWSLFESRWFNQQPGVILRLSLHHSMQAWQPRFNHQPGVILRLSLHRSMQAWQPLLKMPISSDADAGRTRLIQLIVLRIFGATKFSFSFTIVLLAFRAIIFSNNCLWANRINHWFQFQWLGPKSI